jgi:hypothetical protein
MFIHESALNLLIRGRAPAASCLRFPRPRELARPCGDARVVVSRIRLIQTTQTVPVCPSPIACVVDDDSQAT